MLQSEVLIWICTLTPDDHLNLNRYYYFQLILLIKQAHYCVMCMTIYKKIVKIKTHTCQLQILLPNCFM